MRAKSWVVLSAVALLLTITSCGGSVCVGYGCGYWDCYPWCPYGASLGLDVDQGARARAANAGDFDGDGTMDLVVLDEVEGLVFMSGAEKSDVTTPIDIGDEFTAHRILPGHLDDDGLLDLLVVALADGSVHVLLGTGDGGFVAPVPAVNLSVGLDVVDVDCARLDGDDRSDLVVLHADGDLSVYPGSGAHGFGTPTAHDLDLEDETSASARVVCSELDGVVGIDVALVLPASGQVAILSGRGDGTFDPLQLLAAQVPTTLLDATWQTGLGVGPAGLALLFDSPVDEEHRVVRLELHGEDAGMLDEETGSAGTATQISAADLTGDGLSDLILVDPVAGEVDVLRAVE